MTEASIDSAIFRDLYIALGEPLQGDAWAIRIYIKPFVMWIWIGALFIAMGAVLASLDGRFKKNSIGFMNRLYKFNTAKSFISFEIFYLSNISKINLIWCN